MSETDSTTRGIHHLGLTVSKLEASANFFKDILGWSEVSRNQEYPAIFVTDGTVMLTLWQAKSGNPNEFDKDANIGLHHVALRVEDFDTLEKVYQKLQRHRIEIEFSPELLRNGPAKHMMCYDPSGIRIEFICVPK